MQTIRVGSTGPHRVTLGTWIEEAPFESLLNIRIVEAAQGHAVLTMPFAYEYAQCAGVMHGGALTALADTAVAMAAKSVMPCGTGFGTVSLETRFLRPLVQGVARCEAEIVKQRGRDLTGRARVYDEQGRTVVEFRARLRIAANQQHGAG